jgi:choice-of-anchor A domain-containing protein/uncharacterized repeat protein (TIGR01451 family)
MIVVASSASASDPPRARTAQTSCADLRPVGNFNTFVYGDHRIDNTQVYGRVAIGGDLLLGAQGAVTIGSDEPGPNRARFDLIVKGDRVAEPTINSAGSNVSVQNASVIHAGEISPAGVVNAPSGDIIAVDRDELAERIGFDFAETFERLTTFQGVWDDQPGQVRITDQDVIDTGNDAPIVRFVGTSRRLNVFRISAAALERARTIQIRVPADTATTLINVTGRAYKSVTAPTVATEFAVGSGSFRTLGGGTGAVDTELGRVRAQLVWSFPRAQTVQIGGPTQGNQTVAWEGSVLAPKATVLVGPSARVHGTIVALYLQQTDPVGDPIIGGAVRLPGFGREVCLPQVCPGSDVEPEPPDPDEPEPPPLGDEPIELAPPGPSAPPDTGAVAGTQTGSTTLQMCKRPFRPRVRAGRTVTFRLEVRNVGLATAQDVVVCDRVSTSVRIVRAPGAEVRGRRACWRIDSVRDERTFHLAVRVNSTTRGVVRNVVTGRAGNAAIARALAQIRVVGPPPAVTG